MVLIFQINLLLRIFWGWYIKIQFPSHAIDMGIKWYWWYEIFYFDYIARQVWKSWFNFILDEIFK